MELRCITDFKNADEHKYGQAIRSVALLIKKFCNGKMATISGALLLKVQALILIPFSHGRPILRSGGLPVSVDKILNFSILSKIKWLRLVVLIYRVT